MYFSPETFSTIFSSLKTFSTSETAIDHAKKHTDAKYVCPMHPKIVQDQKGSCPICGMDLVKKEVKPTAKLSLSIKKEKKLLYWVAPMDPNYRRDTAGKSPMGMDLVPVYEEANTESEQANSDMPSISVRHSTAQSMGIRIATVKSQKLSQDIRTVGFIRYNEDKLEHIHVRTKGWIENIQVKSQGDFVEQGQILFDYYSPELVAAQEDYLLALKGNTLLSVKGSRSLIESAQLKMRLLGIPEKVINTITQSRKSIKQIPIYAPSNGTVTKLDVRKGMYITPATVLYSIADLSSVWIEVDVFEHQLNWVKIGDRATINIEALTNKTWQGKVNYIYPELSEMTRTLRVRLVFDNKAGHFKPNMFADVRIHGKTQQRLVIPNEAIILSADGSRVVKQVAKERYQPVAIKIGIKSQGKTEILSGLKAGDKIVISSQFLLDSESNLQASFNRLSE
jgi:Cu(I)/Ag(I) efflux system membrane fusion protein